ncbi:uncharacterized protein LOC127795416 [Diospyros lotus]|uniref:uncharacterized protein LOC127795416 n=1 Tax=Diospyros lotus TaxID=55363 RepID=UPI00224FD0CB|nr:uncharacterized protein LOC127795416 [Diospyros lotus]
MAESDHWASPPATGPPPFPQNDARWMHFDNSVNAVSFGFVATAILVSMFLVMAVFERFLGPASQSPSPAGRRYGRDIESQMSSNRKLHLPSPHVSLNARELSVLMPGDRVPTFIALPCPPDRISWPPRQHSSVTGNRHGFAPNLISHTPPQ